MRGHDEGSGEEGEVRALEPYGIDAWPERSRFAGGVGVAFGLMNGLRVYKPPLVATASRCFHFSSRLTAHEGRCFPQSGPLAALPSPSPFPVIFYCHGFVLHAFVSVFIISTRPLCILQHP